jgi:hypothetical protein
MQSTANFNLDRATFGSDAVLCGTDTVRTRTQADASPCELYVNLDLPPQCCPRRRHRTTAQQRRDWPCSCCTAMGCGTRTPCTVACEGMHCSVTGTASCMSRRSGMHTNMLALRLNDCQSSAALVEQLTHNREPPTNLLSQQRSVRPVERIGAHQISVVTSSTTTLPSGLS